MSHCKKINFRNKFLNSDLSENYNFYEKSETWDHSYVALSNNPHKSKKSTNKVS